MAASRSMGNLLFSFTGRVGRQDWWVFGVLVLGVGGGIVAGVIDAMLGYGTPEKPIGPGIIVNLLLIWPSIALAVKRWHDRDKSGWWVLINLIPILGWIWALVENGFLKGTAGPNRFGADPLA
jgi:uncharacterized membrane protein YhaH (DUF805 family)